MKVLTTSQFVEGVEKLSKDEQQNIYRLFELISHFTEKEFFQSPFLETLVSKDDQRILMIKARNLRVFCTVELIKGVETVLLIDIIKEEAPAFVSSSIFSRRSRNRFLSILLYSLVIVLTAALLISVIFPETNTSLSKVFTFIFTIISYLVAKGFEDVSFVKGDKNIADKESLKR